MLLEIFGLTSRPVWWHLSRIPSGGGKDLANVILSELSDSSNITLFVGQQLLSAQSASDLESLWSTGTGQIVAKPREAQRKSRSLVSAYLVTVAGPDAGRIFPLSRRTLSVGRVKALAQLHDPWIARHEFDIQLTANGVLVTDHEKQSRVIDHHANYVAGRTTFEIHRNRSKPLDNAPKDPGSFTISTEQPPTRPNLLLQSIGALAPLLIGVVLMFLTGMWYFLLFAGVSVIIAMVLIMQFRVARKRYISQIQAGIQDSSNKLAHCSFKPHQLRFALASHQSDPLHLKGSQPQHPIINVGTGIQEASIENISDDTRWKNFLSARTDLLLSLRPGQQTVITGDPFLRSALRNWIIAQLLRHFQATGKGLIIDSQQLGDNACVLITDDLYPSSSSELHRISFSASKPESLAQTATHIDLDNNSIRGVSNAVDLQPLGISAGTLQQIIFDMRLDKPVSHVSDDYLFLPEKLMRATAESSLVTRVGSGDLGLTFDLVKSGPHLLITGTTGSGKSELLLTVLTGLVLNYPPTEVSMILLDFKGGSSFNILSDLPHTMSVETNHVAATSRRSLTAIAAELFRRESLFAQYRVPDYESFRRRFPKKVLPRLIVAIDELRVLVEHDEQAVATLAHLAATGRSLGFHLIIATQRIQGAVSSEIRANIGTTISLRTATEHDSWDALGTSDAYEITPETPGRAFIKIGPDKPRLFQTSRYVLESEEIILRPNGYLLSGDLPQTTNWVALGNILTNYAQHFPLPEPIILPELPEVLQVTDITDQQHSKNGTLIGLVDDPVNCSQYPIMLGTVGATSASINLSGSVAWIGAADSGIEHSVDLVSSHLQATNSKTIRLASRSVLHSQYHWDTYLSLEDANGDVLQQLFETLEDDLANGAQKSMLITDWGSWAQATVTGSFYGFEDRLITIMRQYPRTFTLYVFGGRDLAVGKLLGMISDRFYFPKNSSPEHRLMWPKMLEVPAITGRAVLMTAEQQTEGYEAQIISGY